MIGSDPILEMMEEGFGKRTSFLTFDVVILQQVQTINRLGSMEMVRGWWEKKVVGENIIDVYHEDSREAFINAVKMFKQCFVGDDDKEVNEIVTDYNERMKKHFGINRLDDNALSDKEQEYLIIQKLKAYNKVFTLCLKKLRVKSMTNVLYVERYK
jgi:hypothetical protein